MSKKFPEYPQVRDPLLSRAARRFIEGAGIVVATAVFVGAVGLAGLYIASEGDEGDRGQPLEHEPTEATLPQDSETSNPIDSSPKPEQAHQQPNSAAAGDISAYLGFLTGQGDYPAHVPVISIEMPENGPDQVMEIMGQVERDNFAAAPEVNEDMVSAVTYCAAAEQRSDRGNWGDAVEALQAGEFELAEEACTDIVFTVAQGYQSSGGTGYHYVPNFASTG